MNNLVPKRITDKNGVSTVRWVKPSATASTPNVPPPIPVPKSTTETRSRIGWDDLPDSVRSSVESIVGGSVVAAHSQSGGYSPGSADRIVTAQGERYFVKAVGGPLNPESPQFHRREAQIMGVLPAGLPIPQLVGSYDDGDWVALVFSDVDGEHPQLSGGDLHTVLDAIESISSQPLTPQALAVLPSLTDELRGSGNGWAQLRNYPHDRLDQWAVDNQAVLEYLSSKAADAVGGDRLAHVDLRADNILINQEQKAFIVDWPWAAHGASWFDALTVLIDARVSDPSCDTESVLRQHSVFSEAKPEQVDAVLAALGGYFLDNARKPSPPEIPTLRAFQQAEGEACIGWLRERWSIYT